MAKKKEIGLVIPKQDDWKLLLAIDPDVEKNGVALLDRQERKVTGYSLTFPQLVVKLLEIKDGNAQGKPACHVLVEAGYLNKSNWHLNYRDSKRVAAAKGNAAGRNHEVARKIIELCEYWKIPVHEIKPLKKCWQGRDGKITHDELAVFCRMDNRTTNQDIRDAMLMAWVYAGFPVRIKPLLSPNKPRK